MAINKTKSFSVILAGEHKATAKPLIKALGAADAFVIEVFSVLGIIDAISTEEVAFVMIDQQLLQAANKNAAALLREKINEHEIPVIFLTQDKCDIDKDLAAHGFELSDVLQTSAEQAVIANKIKIFSRLSSQKYKEAATPRERNYTDLLHFIQGLAHDLKSPLATSVFLLSILKADKQTGNENNVFKEYVNKIYETNVHLSEMITVVADHFKTSLKDQKREWVSVDNVLQRIIESIKKEEVLSVRLDGDFPALYTNKYKLQCVFKKLFLSFVNQHIYDVEDIVISVNDKDLFYEFSIMYDSRFKVPELKKVFLVPPAAEADTGIGKITLNVLKMLLEEQCRKIRVEETPGKNNIIFLEWKK